MASRTDFAPALAEAAATMHLQPTLPETMQAIVDLAVSLIPGVDHAAITLEHRTGRRPRPPETVTVSDDTAWELEQVQFQLRQGPLLEVLAEGGRSLVVESVAVDPRWREFAHHSRPLGLRSVLVFRLCAGTTSPGVLTLYSTSADEIDPAAKVLAELFAVHASYAYERRRELEHLNVALASRERIGNAVGVVMERFGLDPQRAFDYLSRVAATQEIKVREVAHELLAGFDESGSAGTPEADATAGTAPAGPASAPVASAAMTTVPVAASPQP